MPIRSHWSRKKLEPRKETALTLRTQWLCVSHVRAHSPTTWGQRAIKTNWILQPWERSCFIGRWRTEWSRQLHSTHRIISPSPIINNRHSRIKSRCYQVFAQVSLGIWMEYLTQLIALLHPSMEANYPTIWPATHQSRKCANIEEFIACLI